MASNRTKTTWIYFFLGCVVVAAGIIAPDRYGDLAYLIAAAQIVPVMLFSYRVDRAPKGLLLAIALIAGTRG